MTPGTSQPARPRSAAPPPQSGGPTGTGALATNGLHTLTFDDLNRYYQGQAGANVSTPDPSMVSRGPMTPPTPRPGLSVTGDPRGMTGQPPGGWSTSSSYGPGTMGNPAATNTPDGQIVGGSLTLGPDGRPMNGNGYSNGSYVGGAQPGQRTGGFGGVTTPAGTPTPSIPFGPPGTPGTPGVPQGGTPQIPGTPPPGGTETPPGTQTTVSPQSGGFQLPQSVQQLLAQLNGPSPGNIQNNLGGTGEGAMQQAQQAAYRQATGYLDPQFQNQENALRSQLTNQGIPQNSEAWNKAMDDFNRQKTFAYSQAEQNAVQQGNAAQAQQFGQNLAGGQFANSAQAQQAQQLLARLGLSTQLGTAAIGGQTANNQLQELMSQNNFNNSLTTRQQGIQEMLLRQQNPLQMFQALMQGNNVQQPNFPQVPGANIGNTDIASIIAQALGQQNNVYNTQMGAQNSQTGAYASILAALLSDRRLKRNVVCIGMHEVGVPLYAYEYLWGEPGVGVMADELERVKPEAVFDVGGVKVVDYARL